MSLAVTNPGKVFWPDEGYTDPGVFNMRTIAKRLRRADAWKAFFGSRQSLVPALDAVKRLQLSASRRGIRAALRAA